MIEQLEYWTATTIGVVIFGMIAGGIIMAIGFIRDNSPLAIIGSAVFLVFIIGSAIDYRITTDEYRLELEKELELTNDCDKIKELYNYYKNTTFNHYKDVRDKFIIECIADKESIGVLLK